MKLKDDGWAIFITMVAGLLIAFCAFCYVFLFGVENQWFSFISNGLLTIALFPVFLISILLFALARIIELLNQINQKMDLYR